MTSTSSLMQVVVAIDKMFPFFLNSWPGLDGLVIKTAPVVAKKHALCRKIYPEPVVGSRYGAAHLRHPVVAGDSQLRCWQSCDLFRKTPETTEIPYPNNFIDFRSGL